jgi:hypothetical protein
MADYKGIKGFKVQYLSADPSNPIVGQIWYNDTSKALKYTGVTTAGAWASATSMNTARALFSRLWNSNSSFSIWRICISGTGATEEYNGAFLGNSSNPGLNTARSGLLQEQEHKQQH